MELLLKLLSRSKHCVVLTGAGVSTLSGIPDFRGKNGIYARIDGERLFSIGLFYEDPGYYYSHSKEFIYSVHEKEPSIVHRTLARMEEKGTVKAVITQNIDMLHQKAGSRNVIEIHGSPRKHHCTSCDKEFDYESIHPKVRSGAIPMCDECGCLIKPRITFFGEALPEDALMKAIEEAGKADLMLVLGSSLVVNPAASLPLYVLSRMGKVVIVNNQPTPLDSRALRRYEDLEEVFRALERTL